MTLITIRRQTERHPMWTHMQTVPEPPPITISPLVARETLDHFGTSASHSAYQQGALAFRGLIGLNPSRTLSPHQSDRHSFAHQDIHRSRNQLLGYPSAYQYLSHTAHTHYPSASNDHSVTDPLFIPPHLVHHQLSTPTFLHSRTTSSGYIQPGLGLRFAPPQESPAPSRHRRGTRAIEYGGLWLDEKELFESLKKPDGELIVHQCLWEDDRSPCHLWVKCDKSCIHAHIQKWHGGKPGGDKLEVDCRWSTCAKTMLKESIARHVLSLHLGEMWECPGCAKRVTRKDAYGRHAAESELEACLTAGPLITYSVDVRVIDARAALNSGGRVRYADA